MKRKTWKDRRCGHGNPPQFRITLDMIHCNEPGCWDEVVASCGFVTERKHKELTEAAEAMGARNAWQAVVNLAASGVPAEGIAQISKNNLSGLAKRYPA